MHGIAYNVIFQRKFTSWIPLSNYKSMGKMSQRFFLCFVVATVIFSNVILRWVDACSNTTRNQFHRSWQTQKLHHADACLLFALRNWIFLFILYLLRLWCVHDVLCAPGHCANQFEHLFAFYVWVCCGGGSPLGWMDVYLRG